MCLLILNVSLCHRYTQKYQKCFLIVRPFNWSEPVKKNVVYLKYYIKKLVVYILYAPMCCLLLLLWRFVYYILGLVIHGPDGTVTCTRGGANSVSFYMKQSMQYLNASFGSAFCHMSSSKELWCKVQAVLAVCKEEDELLLYSSRQTPVLLVFVL